MKAVFSFICVLGERPDGPVSQRGIDRVMGMHCPRLKVPIVSDRVNLWKATNLVSDRVNLWKATNPASLLGVVLRDGHVGAVAGVRRAGARVDDGVAGDVVGEELPPLHHKPVEVCEDCDSGREQEMGDVAGVG